MITFHCKTLSHKLLQGLNFIIFTLCPHTVLTLLKLQNKLLPMQRALTVLIAHLVHSLQDLGQLLSVL